MCCVRRAQCARSRCRASWTTRTSSSCRTTASRWATRASTRASSRRTRRTCACPFSSAAPASPRSASTHALTPCLRCHFARKEKSRRRTCACCIAGCGVGLPGHHVRRARQHPGPGGRRGAAARGRHAAAAQAARRLHAHALQRRPAGRRRGQRGAGAGAAGRAPRPVRATSAAFSGDEMGVVCAPLCQGPSRTI